MIYDMDLQIPLEQAHEHLTEIAAFARIIRHDHSHVHAGDVNSIPAQLGMRGFLALWLHVYARAKLYAGSGGSSHELCLSGRSGNLPRTAFVLGGQVWDLAGTFRGTQVRLYDVLRDRGAQKGKEREGLPEALREIMGDSKAALWVNS